MSAEPMTAWLPVIGALIGVAGTAFGVLLTQFGQWFVFRREQRQTMARAIYVMLQIRGKIRMVPEAVRILGKTITIPATTQVVLIAAFDNFFPADEGFVAEFEKSIASLAEYDPVLAARMRSKNQAVSLLRKLRPMIVANPTAAALWSTIEGQIMSHGLPRFDDAILELGRLHGRGMLKKVEADLGKKVDVQEEVLATITAAIQEQMKIEHQQAAQLTHQKQQQQSRNRMPIWASGP
jgi:hypothetical protein